MRLLKLGGSVITKKGEAETADFENIQRLAKMLSRLWEDGVRDIVLVHGAGSFGHALVLEYNLDEGAREPVQVENVKKVQGACKRLSEILVDALREDGVDAVRIVPHEIIKSEDKRIVSFDREKIFGCLKGGKMPVLHGDMVQDSKLGYSVCSGDQIIANLAKDAEFTVLGTNVDGIMAESTVIEHIDDENFVHVEEHLNESSEPDVTGGMVGKVFELKQVGGTFYIVNALYPERIEKILRGEIDICTKMEFKK